MSRSGPLAFISVHPLCIKHTIPGAAVAQNAFRNRLMAKASGHGYLAPVNGVLRGISGFVAAASFALRHGLWWMFLVPIVLWVLLAYGLFVALEGPVDDLTRWVGGLLELDVASTDGEGLSGFWNSTKEVLNSTREFLVTWVLRLAIAFLLFLVNKYIVLILLSPLLAYASERTEELVTGARFPFSWSQLMKDAVRGALLAARNGLLELFINVVVWVATLFLPFLAPITAVLLFLVSAYFYGFSMFDYILERRKLRVHDSVREVNARMGMVVANGALFSLVMKVPLLGMMFGPVMGSVGAVLAEYRERGGTRLPQRP